MQGTDWQQLILAVAIILAALVLCSFICARILLSVYRMGQRSVQRPRFIREAESVATTAWAAWARETP